MQDVCYSRLKLGVALALSAGLFWVGVWMTGMSDPKGVLAGWFFVAVMAFLLVHFSRYLLDNRILSIGATGIEYHGLISTKRLRFDQIANVMIETTTVNYVKNCSLVIVPAQGHGGKARIAERLLERRVGGLEALFDLIASRTNGPERRAAPSFPLPEPVSSGSVPEARVRSFGRKSA